MSFLLILREDGEEHVFECDNCGYIKRNNSVDFVRAPMPPAPWRIFKLGDGTYHLCSEDCYWEFRTGTFDE